MTTSMTAMASVAARLGGVDPADEQAVDDYFSGDVTTIPDQVRQVVFDWLVSAPEAPSDVQLDELDMMVRNLLRDAAPYWDTTAKTALQPDQAQSRKLLG
ncbi:MAG: hypothetical protein K2Y29_11820 [Beijerinckiaceae bacterium]|nr:hypothetical protein [Beijerinckiaceae bacterium]